MDKQAHTNTLKDEVMVEEIGRVALVVVDGVMLGSSCINFARVLGIIAELAPVHHVNATKDAGDRHPRFNISWLARFQGVSKTLGKLRGLSGSRAECEPAYLSPERHTEQKIQQQKAPHHGRHQSRPTGEGEGSNKKPSTTRQTNTNKQTN